MKLIGKVLLWIKYRIGQKPISFRGGAGYYLGIGILGNNNIGRIEEMEMKSGKVGLYELIDYNTFYDPDDMVKESFWHFVGYKGEKKLRDMGLKEFLETIKEKQ